MGRPILGGAIGSHLLDLGFNADYLHRWSSYRLFHEQGERPLAELVLEAHALALKPSRSYDVLVAFESTLRANINETVLLVVITE